jgi:predicted RNase H-like HicB family nuclease
MDRMTIVGKDGNVRYMVDGLLTVELTTGEDGWVTATVLECSGCIEARGLTSFEALERVEDAIRVWRQTQNVLNQGETIVH